MFQISATGNIGADLYISVLQVTVSFYIAVADSKGAWRPPPDQIFFNFIRFFRKLKKYAGIGTASYDKFLIRPSINYLINKKAFQ